MKLEILLFLSMVAAQCKNDLSTPFLATEAAAPCAGFNIVPIAWNATGGAHLMKAFKLFQFSSSILKEKYWSPNMKSITIDHSLDQSWPTWDGVKIIPNAAHVKRPGAPSTLAKAMCVGNSNGYQLKGLFQAYPKPFLNPRAPTLAEWDEHNRHVILHMRRMMGGTNVGNTTVSADRNMQGNACVAAQMLWMEEYKSLTNCDGECGAGQFPTANGLLPGSTTTFASGTPIANYFKDTSGHGNVIGSYVNALGKTISACPTTFNMPGTGGMYGTAVDTHPLAYYFQHLLCTFLEDGVSFSNGIYSLASHAGPLDVKVGRLFFGFTNRKLSTGTGVNLRVKWWSPLNQGTNPFGP